MFKDKLEELAIKFLSEAKKDIAALHEILCDEDINGKKEHRLYVYILSDQAKKQDTQNLIYVKSPYKFSKNELETLDIYKHTKTTGQAPWFLCAYKKTKSRNRSLSRSNRVTTFH